MVFADNEHLEGMHRQRPDVHAHRLGWAQLRQQTQVPGDVRRRVALEVTGRQPAEMQLQQLRRRLGTMTTHRFKEVHHSWLWCWSGFRQLSYLLNRSL